MAKQCFTIKLTQLRCILESDPGPSEPYLWVTYFAFGPQVPPFQTGPLALSTPSYDAFRTEFPNDVSAGDAVSIPTFIASASFDMDLASAGPKLLGCVVVLMEEDDTRESDIVFGRIAYAKEMEAQLNALMKKRIQTNDMGPLTDNEINTIKSAVTSKVTDAIGSHQSIWDFFRDQDDPLGFTYKIFPESQTDTIHAQSFDFPEVTTIKKVSVGSAFPPTTIVTDRYVLSGQIIVEAVPVKRWTFVLPSERPSMRRNRRFHPFNIECNHCRSNYSTQPRSKNPGSFMRSEILTFCSARRRRSCLLSKPR